MVFGKLFGRGGNEKKPRRQSEDDHYRAWRQSLDPEWNEVLNIVFRSEDVDRVFKSSLQVALSNSDLDEARRLLRLHIMPCLPAHIRDQIKHAGQHQSWANINDLQAAGASFAPDKVPPDALNLGWVEVDDDGMVTAEIELGYELRFTQRWILEPEITLIAHSETDRERSLGSGLAEVETALRLFYYPQREWAPYVGLAWHRTLGDQRDFAETAQSEQWLIGIRGWF